MRARNGAYTALAVVASIFVACLVVQVFLAGLGVFDSPSAFITHATFGYIIEWLTLVMLLIAAFGRLGRRLMAYFADAPVRAPAFPELSERELEVLELIARGMSNQQIVDRLVISPKTVRNHISNIFSKLQVRDRAEAVVRAREAGMGGEQRRG